MPAPNRRGRVSNRPGPAPLRNRPRGVTDQDIRSTLKKLDRGEAKPASVADTAASFIRLNPRLTDADIAEGLQCDPPLVARVRANLAAGRPPDHAPAARHSAHTHRRAPLPSPRPQPAPPAAQAVAPPRACGDQCPGRPTYNVVGGSRPVEGVATWALAADYADTYGGKVRAIRPDPS
jgi:hypothetical protein